MGRPKKLIAIINDESPIVIVTGLETYSRILKAAEELFIAKGFKGVSMKDIAKKVDITPAALYYYFPKGKQDLFLKMIEFLFEEWEQNVIKTVEACDNIQDCLLLLTMEFLADSHGQIFILLRDVHTQIKDESDKQKIWECYGSTYMHAITQIFERAIEKGEISQDIPAHLMATIYHSMNFALTRSPHLAAYRNSPSEAKKLATTIVAILLDGIRQPERL